MTEAELDKVADAIAGLHLSVPPEQRVEVMRRAFSISGVCPECGRGNPAEPKLGCVCPG